MGFKFNVKSLSKETLKKENPKKVEKLKLPTNPEEAWKFSLEKLKDETLKAGYARQHLVELRVILEDNPHLEDTLLTPEDLGIISKTMARLAGTVRQAKLVRAKTKSKKAKIADDLDLDISL